jgi:hypothetical protein
MPRDVKHSLPGGTDNDMQKENWPGVGPGRAARKKIGMNSEAYPSRDTPPAPKGVTVYQSGNSPPKGYRQ